MYHMYKWINKKSDELNNKLGIYAKVYEEKKNIKQLVFLISHSSK